MVYYKRSGCFKLNRCSNIARNNVVYHDQDLFSLVYWL